MTVALLTGASDGTALSYDAAHRTTAITTAGSTAVTMTYRGAGQSERATISDARRVSRDCPEIGGCVPTTTSLGGPASVTGVRCSSRLVHRQRGHAGRLVERLGMSHLGRGPAAQSAGRVRATNQNPAAVSQAAADTARRNRTQGLPFEVLCWIGIACSTVLWLTSNVIGWYHEDEWDHAQVLLNSPVGFGCGLMSTGLFAVAIDRRRQERRSPAFGVAVVLFIATAVTLAASLNDWV